MSIVLDAGALIAAERRDPQTWARLKAELELGDRPVTTAPVVAQVSRSPRQALLHRFLRGCDVVAFEPEVAGAVGTLLAASGTSDVVDAHLVVIAAGRKVVTSDPDDLRHLAAHTVDGTTVLPV